MTRLLLPFDEAWTVRYLCSTV